jgi:hypothetical protein
MIFFNIQYHRNVYQEVSPSKTDITSRTCRQAQLLTSSFSFNHSLSLRFSQGSPLAVQESNQNPVSKTGVCLTCFGTEQQYVWILQYSSKNFYPNHSVEIYGSFRSELAPDWLWYDVDSKETSTA